MADNTRWLHPQGKIRISKADGNLYMHDLETNRVKVAQLDRLIDIRTDKGNSAVVIDTGHTITSTVLHGFQFKTQEERDKFIADVMEVLVGNVPFIEYPSLPKTIAIDPASTDVLPMQTARFVAIEYLKELVQVWRDSWRQESKVTMSRAGVEAFIAEEAAEGKWSTDIHDIILKVEKVVTEELRKPYSRSVMANYAMMTLENNQLHTKDFRGVSGIAVA